jgi:hypothetical protein
VYKYLDLRKYKQFKNNNNNGESRKYVESEGNDEITKTENYLFPLFIEHLISKIALACDLASD